MAKASLKEKSEPGFLPVPESVVAHHSATLSGLMSEWIRVKRISPVLLITGPAGIGKRSMGYHLAQWIFCEQTSAKTGADAKSMAPCGTCVQCSRAIHGTWVDFTDIGVALDAENEETGKSGALKIDVFRELKAQVGYGGHEGSYKIILIPNADRMTPQAANSVLKLLEETPKGWLFFLTASDPTLVLPTVLSRCQSVRLRPLPEETVASLLQKSGIESPRREVCARLSGGSWAKALALADEEAWEKRKAIFNFLKEPSAGVNPLLDWASGETRNFDLFLDQLEQCTAELIRWSVSEFVTQPDRYPWKNTDGATSLVAHLRLALKRFGTPEVARTFWIARAERMARARREALAPLNRKLLIQDILLPWLPAA